MDTSNRVRHTWETRKEIPIALDGLSSVGSCMKPASSTPIRTRAASTFLVLIAAALLVVNTLAARASGMRGGVVGAELAGSASAPIILLLIVYGIARIFGKARTFRGALKLASWTLFVLLLMQMASAVNSQIAPVRSLLTEAETEAPVIAGDQLVHEVVGFSLPYPGPGWDRALEAEQDMNEELARAGRMFAWAFINERTQELVALQITKGLEPGEATFRDFAHGMSQSLADIEHSVVLEDTVLWNSSTQQYRAAVMLGGEVFMIWRCIPTTGAEGGPFIVCAQTTTLDAGSLAFVLSGLTAHR